jgi:hypothetical protein
MYVRMLSTILKTDPPLGITPGHKRLRSTGGWGGFEIAIYGVAVNRAVHILMTVPGHRSRSITGASVDRLRGTGKVEPRGIEPRSEPCKGPVLPLNYGPVVDMTATV